MHEDFFKKIFVCECVFCDLFFLLLFQPLRLLFIINFKTIVKGRGGEVRKKLIYTFVITNK